MELEIGCEVQLVESQGVVKDEKLGLIGIWVGEELQVKGCRQRLYTFICQANLLSKLSKLKVVRIKCENLSVLAIGIHNEFPHFIESSNVVISFFIYSQDIRKCLR